MISRLKKLLEKIQSKKLFCNNFYRNSARYGCVNDAKTDSGPVKFYQITPEKKKIIKRFNGDNKNSTPTLNHKDSSKKEQMQPLSSRKARKKFLKKLKNSFSKNNQFSPPPHKTKRIIKHPKTAKIIKKPNSNLKRKNSKQRYISAKRPRFDKVDSVPGIKKLFCERKKRRASKTKKKRKKSKEIKKKILSIRASLNKLEKKANMVYHRTSTKSLENLKKKLLYKSPDLNEKRSSFRKFRSIEKLISKKNSPFKRKKFKGKRDFEGKMFISARHYLHRTSRKPSHSKKRLKGGQKKKFRKSLKKINFQKSNSQSLVKAKNARKRGHSRNFSNRFLALQSSRNLNYSSFKRIKNRSKAKKNFFPKFTNNFSKISQNSKLKTPFVSPLHEKIISKILKNPPKKRSLSKKKSSSRRKRKMKTLRNSIQEKSKIHQLSDINILRFFNSGRNDFTSYKKFKNLGKNTIDHDEKGKKKFRTLERLFKNNTGNTGDQNKKFFKKKRNKVRYAAFANLSSEDRNSLIFSLLNKEKTKKN